MTQDFETRLLALAEQEAVHSNEGSRTESIENFVRGGKGAIKLLWHSVEEPPKGDCHLITNGAKGIKMYPHVENTKMAWEYFVRISRITAWAKAEDLLPEEEEK